MDPGINEVLVAIKINQRMCSQLVFDFLMRCNTETGFLYCPIAVSTRILMRHFCDRIDDRHCQSPVKATEDFRRPACPFKDNVGLPSKSGGRISDID